MSTLRSSASFCRAAAGLDRYPVSTTTDAISLNELALELEVDAISEESLKRVSREEDLLQFRENHFINHLETPIVYLTDVVTKSTASNIVDIKGAGN